MEYLLFIKGRRKKTKSGMKRSEGGDLLQRVGSTTKRSEDGK